MWLLGSDSDKTYPFAYFNEGFIANRSIFSDMVLIKTNDLGYTCLDLNEVQRQMGECNHRYDLVGERLTHRQGEMEKTLADLKSYLIDVQQLMVYLNRAEPLV